MCDTLFVGQVPIEFSTWKRQLFQTGLYLLEPQAAPEETGFCRELAHFYFGRDATK